MLTKVCTTHHVKILTPEDDQAHMRADCIIYETGGGLGGIEPVNSDNRALNEPMVYEAGVILPYETQAEKEARKKQLGIPNSTGSK